MRKPTGKLLALILALLLMLTACGGGGESDDPNAGTWVGVTASMFGMDMDANEVFEEGISLELDGNGKGKLIADGAADRITWSCEDGVLTIEDGDVIITGIIEDGVLTLANMLDTGMDIVFEKQ